MFRVLAAIFGDAYAVDAQLEPSARAELASCIIKRTVSGARRHDHGHRARFGCGHHGCADGDGKLKFDDTTFKNIADPFCDNGRLLTR